jgi:hypothetical protein
VASICLTGLVAACATPARFRDQPIVWRIEDTSDIPEPERREFSPKAKLADMFLLRRLTRALELRDEEPAWNTNALDEVPDSTWFTNRIGVRDVAAEEAARGPSLGPPVLPLIVVGGKSGGANPGFLARDAEGARFLVKFDTKDNPEMQTATSVIVNRLFWTLGYNVPDDTVFTFRRQDLSIDPAATYEDELGRELPMDDTIIDRHLASSPRLVGGSFRASASRLLAGVPKGGFPAEGVREDDPHDVVPHEHRRELRALRVFSAWLGHTDIKEDNSLDMYVEEEGRHFLRHYLVDFGEALGSHQAEKGRYEDGWEHVWDWQAQPLAFLALGLWKRPWEDQVETPWPSIGAFAASHFEPGEWREAYPFWPFFDTDAADLYWGAKLVMRVSRALLEAIVAEGKLSDPDAAAYLVDALIARRDAIGRAWLEAVTPLDWFRIDARQVCAVDLGVYMGLATDGVLERLAPDYWPRFDDRRPEYERAVEEYRVSEDGHVCFPTGGRDAYTVARLRIRRGRDLKPVMELHYKGGNGARILGVVRVER